MSSEHFGLSTDQHFSGRVFSARSPQVVVSQQRRNEAKIRHQVATMGPLVTVCEHFALIHIPRLLRDK